MNDETRLPQELADAGWSVAPDGKAITKSFRFRGFRDAIAFMTRAGFEADHMNHHPEWTNVYNRVDVRLTTHDSDSLSDNDIDLAKRMEKVAGRPLQKTAEG